MRSRHGATRGGVHTSEPGRPTHSALRCRLALLPASVQAGGPMSDGSPVAQPPQAAEDAELQQAQQAAEPPPGGPPAAGPPQGEAPQPHGAAAEPAQGQPASPQAAHAAPGAAAAAAAAASPRVSPPAAAAAYSREAVAAALARWSGLRYRADGAGASKRFPWDVRFRLAPGPGLKKVVNDIARVQTPEEVRGCARWAGWRQAASTRRALAQPMQTHPPWLGPQLCARPTCAAGCGGLRPRHGLAPAAPRGLV